MSDIGPDNAENAEQSGHRRERTAVRPVVLPPLKDKIRNKVLRWSAAGVAFVGAVSFFGNFATILGMFGAEKASSSQVESLKSELVIQREMIARLLEQTSPPKDAIGTSPVRPEARNAAATRVVQATPDVAEAIAMGDFRTGFAAMRANASDLSEEAATAWRDLGALAFDRDPNIALDAYRHAVRIDRAHFESWIALSDLEFDQAGDIEAAINAASQAVEVAQKTSDTLDALIDLADLEVEAGKLALASARYGQVVAIVLPLKDQGVATDDQLQHLSRAYEGQGVVQYELGNFVDAAEPFQKVVAIRRNLHAAAPGDIVRRQELSSGLEAIGELELELGNLSKAEAAFVEGLAIDQALAVDLPNSISAQRAVSVSLEKVGDLKVEQGQAKAALDFYGRSIQATRLLLAHHPTNAELREDLVYGLLQTANAHVALSDKSAARALYSEALSLLEGLADESDGQIRSRMFYVAGLAEAASALGDVEYATEAKRLLDEIYSDSRLDPEDLVLLQEAIEILAEFESP